MIELEIDGQSVAVAPGSMVMHAAEKLGLFVPHFCYHKKLSIAANCRMCLVDVEKAPKPLPACATPVAPGMKVQTRSARAIAAQKSVMEFLLINHPLDCPICDQGGECQLQDLAVGYGGSSSRYHEEKRVVFHKPMGSLISAEEMSRCIHCTRCVRFGQEIAGVMELGMAGRGEHSEIMSFVGRSVDSELSGNMIDVCPVGALTSKPFRYSARTWELARRKTIAPHDSLGSNIVVQVKSDRVMRVVPLENEAVNECWISDRDRFSYEGLSTSDRLLEPMIRQDGQWRTVDWPSALEYAAHAMTRVRDERGATALGALGSAQSTLEESYLLGRLMRGLGSDNVDFRLRHMDAQADLVRQGVPWLGLPVADVSGLDRMLLVGSFLRKDQPLLAARIRQAVKRGGRVSVLHAADEDLLMPVAARSIRAPSQWARALAEILVALLRSRGDAVPADLQAIEAGADAQSLASELLSGERRAIFLGAAVAHHPDQTTILRLAQALAQACGATVGHLVEGANGVGAWLAGAVPLQGGLNARAMVESPRSLYLLLNNEPSLDHGLPAATRAALQAADSVIALTPYLSDELLALADCLLPIAPFTETAGSFVSAEGRLQSFTAVVRGAGQSRPAWKVLRVLGDLTGVEGIAFDSVDAVRQAALPADWPERLGNAVTGDYGPVQTGDPFAIERLADVPIYFADPIVRRASSLQSTRDARPPRARINARTLERAGLASRSVLRIEQTAGAHSAWVDLEVELDDRLADGVVRIAAAHASTAVLPAACGPLSMGEVV
ncbi:MAG: dehydrogenase chain [Pseudomonadota bacterium]|jgi:NADH-quinone oxidoreductase subunit G